MEPSASSLRPDSDSPRTPGARLLGTILIVGMLVLVFVTDAKRRAAEAQVSRLTMRLRDAKEGNAEQGKEEARRIVARVSKHILLPTDMEPTVATIVDIEALRKQNPDFYAKASNGDHLVVTQRLAVLYSPSQDIIINTAPVEIEPAAEEAKSQNQTPAAQGNARK